LFGKLVIPKKKIKKSDREKKTGILSPRPIPDFSVEIVHFWVESKECCGKKVKLVDKIILIKLIINQLLLKLKLVNKGVQKIIIEKIEKITPIFFLRPLGSSIQLNINMQLHVVRMFLWLVEREV